MSLVGLIGLWAAFLGAVVSVVCLLSGVILGGRRGGSERAAGAEGAATGSKTAGGRAGAEGAEASASERAAATGKRGASHKAANTLTRAGYISTFVACAALTFCCGILVYCFFAGDYSIAYVLNERTHSEGALSWFYKLSGLWAGREGSLLFWAWLISLFCTVIAARNFRQAQRLDSSALLVLQIVLGAFVSVLLFSADNMPFTATATKYFKDGALTATGQMLGMNQLLEHWAMAAHPPTLFIGYAGLTVPFAYALGALITNDDSNAWTRRAHPYAMFSWLFLSIGIGLGSVWAYVVLGWGGYWGWDAVENASLLSWLVGLALIHSMTVCRQRGAFKRWAVMCACITFALVILGTFISRSGIVQSVHAFGDDSVSAVMFGALIALGVLSGAVGLAIRWKSFGPAENGTDDVESLCTKEGAYYFNNVVMIISAILIAYLTVSSALPAFLPFGGQTVSTGTYNAVARPLGIIYLLILSCCPLLKWGNTPRRDFLRKARVPGVCALVLFAVLATYWGLCLVPSYNAIIAGGGTAASELLSEGPPAYYNGLALFGFLVASVVFFNSLFMLVRSVRKGGGSAGGARGAATSEAARGAGEVVPAAGDAKPHGTSAGGSSFTARASKIGGFLTHTAMGIILVGLIGSSMYVTEVTQYVSAEASATETAAQTQDAEDNAANAESAANTSATSENSSSSSEDAAELHIQDYTLKYVSSTDYSASGNTKQIYQVTFDVYKGENFVGQLSPSMEVSMTTQQQKLNAAVLSTPLHDLFVVYQGNSESGQLSMDVRVNPLISFVWVGFALLIIGMCVSAFGGVIRRRTHTVS